MALEHLTNIADTLVSRVISQYQSDPRFMAIMRGLGDEVQKAEDGLWGIVTQLDYTQAAGIWLDWIGRIIGEARGGADDTDYRRFIGARILANRSSGTIEDVLGVLRAALGVAPGLGIKLIEWPLVAMTIQVPGAAAELGGQQGDTILTRVLQLLRGGRSGGVKLTLRFQDDVDANIFVCGDSTGAITPVGKGCGDSSDSTVGGRLSGARIA